MDFIEAFDAMVNGKRVRSEYWDKDNYIYTYGNIIFDESNEVYLPNGSAITGKWELYEEKKTKNMTFSEAYKAMRLYGKKIRLSSWEYDRYIYKNNNIIFDNLGKPLLPFNTEVAENNWEVYKNE